MSDDRGVRLLASCWSLTAASALLLFLRIYCKLWRGRGLWWDDHLLITSWVSLLIAVSINSYIVTLGFGRHIETVDDADLRIINLNTILVATFGILATTISKTSFAITLYRIATNVWMKRFLIFIIVTINVTTNLVWMFGFAKCTPLEKVWDQDVPGTCWEKAPLLKYQLFAAYYSAVLDFVLAFLPWPILMGMSMLRRERLGVAVAMSLGAIAGITAIIKAVLVVNMSSKDITYDRVDLTIWTLTEPAASIMAVCIPVLYVSAYFPFLTKCNQVSNAKQENAVPRAQVQPKELRPRSIAVEPTGAGNHKHYARVRPEQIKALLEIWPELCYDYVHFQMERVSRSSSGLSKQRNKQSSQNAADPEWSYEDRGGEDTPREAERV
ncbi:hypothetical protein FZEAL_2575 [Fusarium zealandicum]|uniref:Rhodopsin domain-containing protein n=1 Tax=Fusarium zealandicum TaxID=1053134 RepID=A0A8H4XNG3_9HYPO|nr:hypothetical protein FZEAL_2575 [Fusarium zealandicum]